MSKKPLELVNHGTSSDGTLPPRKLVADGLDLWSRIMTEYDIKDSGGLVGG